MKRTAEAVALLLAVAGIGALAAVAHRRQRQAELSPWPGVENTGPRGLAALHAWLAETGRTTKVIASQGERPGPGAAVVLAAPAAEIDAAEAEALLAHAESGGLLVWAMGPEGSQPELERRLQSFRPPFPPSAPETDVVPLAPHPLFAGLTLRAGGGAVASRLPAALPVAGVRQGAEPRPFVVSVPWGRGEVLLLSSPEPLSNQRIAEGQNLEPWARLAARRAFAFDERFLLPRVAGAPASARALAALAGQGLLAALAFFWARGRRLGAVRPPPPPAAARTAADYLASLAALYRRARAEPRLAEAAWRRLRADLWRRAGVPTSLDDGEASRLLERTRAGAAAPFRRGASLRSEAARGAPWRLLPLVRAIAEVEAALGGRTGRAGTPARQPTRALAARGGTPGAAAPGARAPFAGGPRG